MDKPSYRDAWTPIKRSRWRPKQEDRERGEEVEEEEILKQRRNSKVRETHLFMGDLKRLVIRGENTAKTSRTDMTEKRRKENRNRIHYLSV